MRIGDDPVSAQMQQSAGRVLLSGATGYVGGRLLRKLEESGRPVRCMVRRPEALSGRTAEQTEIVHGDVLEPESLREAFAGVTAAYYLVHSMAASGPFADADRRGAENFAAAARRSGVSRIVYLGGLGAEHDVSTHLESRHEVGRILRESASSPTCLPPSTSSSRRAGSSRSAAPTASRTPISCGSTRVRLACGAP